MTGRVTPRGTQPRQRRRVTFRTVGHYLRPTPRNIHFGQQKTRYCSCGALIVSSPDTIDDRWFRHRCGLPDLQPPKSGITARIRKRLRRHIPCLSRLHLPRPSALRALTPLAAVAFLFLLLDVHATPQRQGLLRHVEDDWKERGWNPDDLKHWRMSTIIGAAGGGNWTTGGTWVGSVAPTASDDAQLTATTGNITIDTGSVCRSLDCTGYTGVLTHTAGVNLQIGTSSAGLSSIALKLVSGMTYTLGSTTTSLITFVSTSSTQQTIATGTKTLPAVTFNGAAGSWLLSDTFTCGPITFTNGIFNTGNNTCNWNGSVTVNAGTKTWTLGSSTINIVNGTSISTTSLNMSGVTNWTITANTATFAFTNGVAWTHNTGGTNDYNGLTVTWNPTDADVNFVLSSNGTPTITFATVTLTCAATIRSEIRFATPMTVTGTLTISGTSTAQRAFINTSTPGQSRTVTAATIVTTYSDWMDITGAGAANWDLSAITGKSGNAGGNSGITFTTAATQYWVGGTGSWSNSAKWGTTSGGSGGRTPLPQDPVVIDVNSVTTTNQTITMDMRRLGASIDTTGVLNNPTLTSANLWSVFGSVIVTNAVSNASLLGNTWTLMGRGTHTLTVTAGTPSANGTIQAPGGTYTLGAAITVAQLSWATTNSLGMTFNTAGYAFTATSVSAQGGAGTNVKWNASTSVITLTGTSGSLIDWTGSAGAELNWENATLTLSGLGMAQRILRFDSNTARAEIGTINITAATAANVRFNSGASGLIRIGTLNVTSRHSITVFSGSVVNVKNFVVNGVNQGYQYIGPVSDGINYVSVPDSAALSITGDLTLDVDLAADNWIPSSAQGAMISKASLGGGNFSYRFELQTDGKFDFGLSSAGTTFTSISSSVATGFTNGTRHQVRACWRASDGRVQFFTRATDADAWVQLGTDKTLAVGSIFDGTGLVEIGTRGTGNNGLAAQFYKARIYNADKGTTESTANLQLLADFTTKTFGADSFTEGSANAATVSINGVSAQAGDGRVGINTSTAASAAYMHKMLSDAYGNDLSFHGTTLTFNADNVNAPGTAGVFMAARPSASLAAITDNIDIRARVAATDWTPTSGQDIVSLWGPSGFFAWDLFLNTNGKLSLFISTTGSDSPGATSSVAPTISDGTTLWVRATRRKSDGRVQFFTAAGTIADPQPGDWTQLGTDQTLSSGSAMFVSTAYINLSGEANGQSFPFNGKFYRVQIRSNVLDDGTGIVFDMDLTNLVQGTFEGKYLTVKDVISKGKAQYIAVDSVNKTGNTGWVFMPPDTPPKYHIEPTRSEALHRASRW